MTWKPDLLLPMKRLAKRMLRDRRLAERVAVVAMSTPTALARIASRGLEIASVIDVGASDGRWSLEARDAWPNARFQLVEANRVHEAKLRRLCASTAGFGYSLAAAGPCDGKVAFDGSNPFGGRAAPDDTSASTLVPQRSLASIVDEQRLPPPYLIKLDTHGYEAPILEGAASLFPHTNLFVIEAYNFPIRSGCLRFHELCGLMEGYGFLVIDISEPMWRAKDAALWQFDLFFVPKSRHEFAYNRFR